MTYIALIADICESRELTARAAVQEQLHQVCAQLNRDRDAEILRSPYTVTIGDEVQALLAAPDMLWPAIFTFEAELHPVRLRFGIGLGGLATAINPEAAIGMDGPAFHRARAAIAQARKDKSNYHIEGLTREGTLLNQVFKLISLDKQGWRQNRFRIFLDLLNSVPVTETARKLDISEQAVYKNIREAGLEIIKAILEECSTALSTQLASQSEDSS